MPGRSGSFWPSPQQERLLEVALGPADRVADAWRSLQPGFVLDQLEPGSFDLMAMIYRRLSEAGVDDRVVERLKGIYRREWVKANVLVERTAAAAQALDADGVRALFIEGAPLAERFYPERGLRPSWFLDVLVETSEAAAALRTLVADGWTAPDDAGVGGRWALVNAERGVCVLRTTPGFDFVARDGRAPANEPLWQSAEVFDLAGTGLLVPGAPETLLAVCATGARAQGTPTLLWVVDAAMILRHQELDVGRLVELAAGRGQALRLREALAYVAEHAFTSLPGGLLPGLERVPVTRRERLVYALAGGSVRSGGSLPEHVARHLAASSGRSLPTAVTTFPGYLGRQWGVGHAWELPYAAGRRAARRLRGRGSQV